MPVTSQSGDASTRVAWARITGQYGDVQFEFVAGHLALDYVATVAERTTARVERLTTPEDLADWLVEARVIDTPPEARENDLLAARELREALYAFVAHLTDGAPLAPSVRETLNLFAAHEGPRPSLDEHGEVHVTGTTRQALACLAQQGLLLARDEHLDSVRWCADPTCTRPFLDRSHARRRRWCGMSTCGDKAKAAAYRARRAQAASAGGLKSGGLESGSSESGGLE